MIKSFLLFGVFFSVTNSAIAAEKFLLNFELVKGGSIVERGKILVSEKPHIWSKGLKRSYLQLRCQQRETGGMQKLYSTVDLFNGLSVSHQRVDDNLKLIVVHSMVKPRLTEIHDLAKNECKDMSPIVPTVTQTYSYPAKAVTKEQRPFSDNITFRVTIELMSEK